MPVKFWNVKHNFLFYSFVILPNETCYWLRWPCISNCNVHVIIKLWLMCVWYWPLATLLSSYWHLKLRNTYRLTTATVNLLVCSHQFLYYSWLWLLFVLQLFTFLVNNLDVWIPSFPIITTVSLVKTHDIFLLVIHLFWYLHCVLML